MKLTMHPNVFNGVLIPTVFFELSTTEEKEKTEIQESHYKTNVKKIKKVSPTKNKKSIIPTQTKKKLPAPTIFSDTDIENEIIKKDNPDTISDVELRGIEFTPSV